MKVGSLQSCFGPQLYTTALQTAVVFSKGSTDHDIILKGNEEAERLKHENLKRKHIC